MSAADARRGYNLEIPLTADEHEALCDTMIAGRFHSLDATVRCAIGGLAGRLGVSLPAHLFDPGRRKPQPAINFGEYLDETAETRS